MDGELARALALVVVVALVAWTVWSANAGRRAARWGRRWSRRLLALAILLGGALFLAT
jgi:hypothetical protein